MIFLLFKNKFLNKIQQLDTLQFLFLYLFFYHLLIPYLAYEISIQFLLAVSIQFIPHHDLTRLTVTEQLCCLLKFTEALRSLSSKVLKYAFISMEMPVCLTNCEVQRRIYSPETVKIWCSLMKNTQQNHKNWWDFRAEKLLFLSFGCM